MTLALLTAGNSFFDAGVAGDGLFAGVAGDAFFGPGVTGDFGVTL